MTYRVSDKKGADFSCFADRLQPINKPGLSYCYLHLPINHPGNLIIQFSTTKIFHEGRTGIRGAIVDICRYAEGRVAWCMNIFFLSVLCLLPLVFCNKPCECAFKGDVLPFVHDLYYDVHKGTTFFGEFLLCLHGSVGVNKAR